MKKQTKRIGIAGLVLAGFLAGTGLIDRNECIGERNKETRLTLDSYDLHGFLGLRQTINYFGEKLSCRNGIYSKPVGGGIEVYIGGIKTPFGVIFEEDAIFISKEKMKKDLEQYQSLKRQVEKENRLCPERTENSN